MGYLKGKSSLMIYGKWGNMKYKYRNREFWCRGYYVCVLRRRADTGAFASGHSAAATDSGLISHFPFNHYDIVFRYALEQ